MTTEARRIVEADWLMPATWRVLHHAELTDQQCEDLADEGTLWEPVTLTCGQQAASVSIPGVLSRMGKPRCRRCCGRLGYPEGYSSPKNDPACAGRLRERVGA